mmetsp:Transcript_24166/g.73916  ORF Transcript_24166/g.73916 Transcript_24166/m.73916 type:complete len:130 (+) Transcript_24166:394-783(+)|eukprot:scaffold89184_cov32-Tisochrysis_lutea.AAC.1
MGAWTAPPLTAGSPHRAAVMTALRMSKSRVRRTDAQGIECGLCCTLPRFHRAVYAWIDPVMARLATEKEATVNRLRKDATRTQSPGGRVRVCTTRVRRICPILDEVAHAGCGRRMGTGGGAKHHIELSA